MDKEFKKCSKEEFIEDVKTNIKSYLPEKYKDATVLIHEIDKVAGTYTGMTVKLPDKNIAPTINLDDLYNQLGTFDEKMQFVANQVTAKVPAHVERINDLLSEYDNVKNMLFIKLNCAEKPENFSKFAHRNFEDMIITYHIRLNDNSSITVTNDLVEYFGISEKVLFADAIKSSEKLVPPSVSPIDMLTGFGNEPDIKVLTNSIHIDGASAMLYPNVLNSIARDGRIYILPSSVHEVMILPDNGSWDIESLHRLVKQMNKTVELEGCKLSDHVYSFRNGTFSTVA